MDGTEIQVRPQESPDRICPFCRDALRTDEPETICPSCDTRHHAACWAEAGRCATCPARAAGARPAEQRRERITFGGPLARAGSRLGLWAVFALLAAFALAWVGTIVRRADRVQHPAPPPRPATPTPPPPPPPPRHSPPPAPDLRTFVNVGERLTFRIGQHSLERWTVTHVDAREVRYTITPLTLDGRPAGNERTGRWAWAPTWVALYRDPGPVEEFVVGGLRVACRYESMSAHVGSGAWILLAPDGTTNLFPGGIRSVHGDGIVYSELVSLEGAPAAVFLGPAPAERSPTPRAETAPPAPSVDLRAHVQAGQRYTFRTPRGTEVWTVTAVEADVVRYTSERVQDGIALGAPRPGTWREEATHLAVVGPDGRPVRERLRLGATTLVCVVRQAGAERVWAPLAPDGATCTFPGVVRVLTASGTVVEELIAIDGPR